MTTANQRLELEQAGYRIDYWHEDTISGSTQAMARPGFVVMLDRLGRDALDVMTTVRLLADRNIRVIVHSLGGVDLASATGKLLVCMLAAVAEMEPRSLDRAHARRGWNGHAAKGRLSGVHSRPRPHSASRCEPG